MKSLDISFALYIHHKNGLRKMLVQYRNNWYDLGHNSRNTPDISPSWMFHYPSHESHNSQYCKWINPIPVWETPVFGVQQLTAFLAPWELPRFVVPSWCGGLKSPREWEFIAEKSIEWWFHGGDKSQQIMVFHGGFMVIHCGSMRNIQGGAT